MAYFISTPGDGRYGILKILNIITEKQFTLDDVEFSLPQRHDSDVESRNTQVVVHFKGEKGYYGNKTVYYNRTHISALPPLTINRNGATTYYGVINTLNEEYNLFLTENDIIEGPLPDIVSSVITVTLPISENSYTYYSGDEIEVDPFIPEYSISNVTDTLMTYVCVGHDKWAQYSDNSGSTYQILVETNSYDCGYDDTNPRIKLTNPASMSTLEEETSDPFTIEYLNPDQPITVTVSGPGLTISQTTFELDTENTEGTFTVSSNHPGIYTISITNVGGAINPPSVSYTFIDRYNTTYSVTPPDLSRLIEGELSDDFTITGYQIDPDEPVTVTIHPSSGLVSTVNTVLLTNTNPTGIFKVSAVSAGSYTLSFTNNRFLINPQPISVDVLYPGHITITPPAEPVVDGVESGLFTATLVNGLESVTVTPSFTGNVVVFPESFILSPQNPTGNFRVTYTGTGANTLSVTNDGVAYNPDDYNFTVITKPTFNITVPTNEILSGQTSDPFTITLVNGYKPVTIGITTDFDHISTNSVILTPSNPTATFTVLANVGGIYHLNFTNNAQLDNPSEITINVDQVYNTEYSVTPPAQLNLTIGQTSGNFTVTATQVDPSLPLTVTASSDEDLEFSQDTFVLTTGSPSATFTVSSDVEDTYTISFDNDLGLDNPNDIIVNIIDPGFLHLTPPESDIFINNYSDPFTVSLEGGHNTIIVSMASAGATFSPSTLTLSPDNPTGTFRVRYTTAGNKTIVVSNNGIAVNPPSYPLTAYAVPTITVTAPATPVYVDQQSGNYTITLNNGYKPVTVNITTGIETISGTSFELTPAAPTATFTVQSSIAGSWSLNFTNTEGYTMTNSLNVNVTEYVGPILLLTKPSGDFYVNETSGNFTITLLNPEANVTVTVVTDADTVSSYTHILGVGNTSRTFTVKYDNVGFGTVGITNNMGYANPPAHNIEIIEREPVVFTLVKTTPDPALRNVGQVFTISATNIGNTINVVGVVDPTDGVSVSPSSRNLTQGSPSSTFTVTASNPGDYTFGITNNQDATNPTPVEYTVINGEILLRVPTTNIASGIETDWFEVELTNYNTNTVVDIGLTDFTDGSVSIDPTDVYQTSRILLTSSNRIGRFKLTKASAGNITLSITNNQSLINPESVELTFYVGPELSVTAPSVTEVFVNQIVGNYVVTLSNPDSEVTFTSYYDPLAQDINKANVTLYMDFQGKEESTDFKDYSNKKYTINKVFADPDNPGVVLSDTDPINGYTSAQYSTTNHYLTVTETTNDFRFPGNFTIEVDFRTSSTSKVLLDKYASSGASWYLWINADGYLQWFSNVTGELVSPDVVNDDEVKQVAITRVGAILYMFINGQMIASKAVSTSEIAGAGTTLGIGARHTNRNSAYDFVGSIGRLVITKGVGRYNANYAVPELKILKIEPQALVLDAGEPTQVFTAQSPSAGQYSIKFSNDRGIANPTDQLLAFRPIPTIELIPAPYVTVDGYYIDEETKDFTINLLNASEMDIEISIVKDSALELLETPFGWDGTKTIMNQDNDSVNFTIIANALGSYSLQILNNKGLPNPTVFYLKINERTELALGLEAPDNTNIEVNKNSDNFTVRLLGPHIQDVTVTPVSDPAGVVFEPSSFILNQSNKVATFTISSNTTGVFDIGIENDAEITDPAAVEFSFRAASLLQITSEPSELRQNEESGLFILTLTNPYQPITVQLVSPDAVFSTDNFILSPESPTATFTVTYSGFGLRQIQFITDIEVTDNTGHQVTVLPTDAPAYITLDIPEGDLFAGVNSGDFILTLHNGPWHYDEDDNILQYTVDTELVTTDWSLPVDSSFVPKQIIVTITSDTEVFSKTEFVLNAINNVDTFKLNGVEAGHFTIEVSNDSDITNPATTNIAVDSELFIGLTAPDETVYKSRRSHPFVVSVPDLDREVVITPISSSEDTIFYPESFTLTPSNPTGEFTIKHATVEAISIGLTNNIGLIDPIDVDVVLEDIDEWAEYIEYLVAPTSTTIDNKAYSGLVLNPAGGTSAVNTSYAPFPESGDSGYILNIGAGSTYILRFESNGLNPIVFNTTKEFCLEFNINTQYNNATTNIVTLVDFGGQSYSSLDHGYASWIYIDKTNNSIALYDGVQDAIVYTTAANSVPVSIDSYEFQYIVIQYKNNTISFYVNGSLIGSFAYVFPDINHGAGSTNSTNISILATNRASNRSFYQYADAIRYTSKARYQPNSEPLLNIPTLTSRLSATNINALRLYEPAVPYVDKNEISYPFIVALRGDIDGDVIVTPRASSEDVMFSPSTITLNTSNRTAEFTMVSNAVGNISVWLDDSKYLWCQDIINIQVLDVDPYYDNVYFNFAPNTTINTVSTNAFIDKSLRAYAVNNNYSNSPIAIVVKEYMGIGGRSAYRHRRTDVATNIRFTPTSNSFVDLSGDFTIEGTFAMSGDYSSIDETIIDLRKTTVPNYGIKIYIDKTINKLLVYGYDGSGQSSLIPVEETPATLPPNNTLIDFAVEYVSGVLTIYINGSIYASKAVTIYNNDTASYRTLFIDYSNEPTTRFNGWLSRLRITGNMYRYGEEYTPTNLPYSGSNAKSLSMTAPSNLEIFDTEQTDSFIIEAVNLNRNDCVISFSADETGLTFTPNTITLTKDLPTGSFKISGDPGVYNVSVNNNLLIDGVESFTITIYDSSESIIDISEPDDTQYFINESSDTYSLSVSNPALPIQTAFVIDPLHFDPYKDDVVVYFDFNIPSYKDINNIVEWTGNPNYTIIPINNPTIDRINPIDGISDVVFDTDQGIYLVDSAEESAFSLPGDFTIEVDFIATNDNQQRNIFRIGSNYNSTDSSRIRAYFQHTSNSAINIEIYSTLGTYITHTYSGPELALNVVTRLAIARKLDTNTIYLFINGALVFMNNASALNSVIISPSNKDIMIGSDMSIPEYPQNSFKGNISTFKITKGICKWTSNYDINEYRDIYPIFTPNNIYLDDEDNEIEFTIASSYPKQYKVIVDNNRNLNKPEFLIGFNKVPVINLIRPTVTTIVKDDYSEQYILSLTDPGLKPVFVTIELPTNLTIHSASLSPTSGTTFELDINTPSLTFTLTSTIIGDYSFNISNTEGLNNPAITNLTVKVPEIIITGPNTSNEVYVDEDSSDITVGLDIANSPIDLTVTIPTDVTFTDLDPEIKSRIYTFSKDTLEHKFKIRSSVGDSTQQITVTHSGDIDTQTIDIYIVDRPLLPNNIKSTDFDMYLVQRESQETDNDINLLQGFFD